MIIITGAAGFIGSCLLKQLNDKGIYNIGLVDKFNSTEKEKNYSDKKFLNLIDRNKFLDWFDLQHDSIDFIFHIGARTDTAEFNYSVLEKLNVQYSKEIFLRCAKFEIPLIYASSAATYGNGELGYADDESLIPKLHPLNPYGKSKNELDKWLLQQQKFPPYWYGLKFFNVYGPNENHKGRMASVVFHGFNQIKQEGKIKLFRSHRADFADGKQLRDFIYVKDIVDVLIWLMENKPASGIYNLGTGRARTFLDLANAVFSACSLEPNIEWIDIPIDIREKYQYFTEAKMEKLENAGYKKSFTKLEDGIRDYVQNYLLPKKYR
jgi:ADP-L-glycero-D-manno-heptose 6-epimerase